MEVIAMNSFQISCFLTVAETLNFARAAEILHVTQPAVTQQIHSLEKELDVRLFKRTTRSVKLTEEGMIFLGDAKQMDGLFRRAKKRFEFPNRHAIQTLSVGCSSYAHLFLLPAVIRELTCRFPGLHPNLQAVPFRHLYRMLEDDDVDAVIGFKENSPSKIQANYKECCKSHIICAASSTVSAFTKDTLSLDDLKNEKIIVLNPSRTHGEIAFLQGQLLSGKNPDDIYFCESAEAALVLAEAGLGVTLLPALAIPPSPRLSLTKISNAPLLSFGIYYKTLQGNLPLKTLIRLMQETLPAASGL